MSNETTRLRGCIEQIIPTVSERDQKVLRQAIDHMRAQASMIEANNRELARVLEDKRALCHRLEMAGDRIND